MKKAAFPLLFSFLLPLLLLGAFFLLVSGSQARSVTVWQADYSQFLPMVFRGFTAGPGDIHGKVFDASKKDEEGNWILIFDAEVCLEGISCVRTDVNGNYSFENLPAGYYLMTVEHESYYSREANAYVFDLKDTTFDVPMVGRLDLGGNITMRVVFSWADTDHWYGSDCGSSYPVGCPSDMDAHVWAFFDPVNPLSYEHHYQYYEGDCTSGAAICLEAVSWNGPGPETIGVVKTLDVDTVYYFGLHHYYGPWPRVPDLYHTGAVVEIYKEDYYNKISISEATGSGNFWYIFSMTAQGDITYQNCIIQKPQDPNEGMATPVAPPDIPACYTK
ncbi:MAG: carboxypeptidase-like regulatory domain-containing protein [Chloroflexota bacterium]